MKKRRNQKGFTLVETLVCILIIALLSAVTLTGIRTAWSVHEDALFESESEILANTINSALGDILHYSSYDSSSTGTSSVVLFTNQNYGILRGNIGVDRTTGRFFVKVTDTTNATKRVLINEKAYTNIKVKDFTMYFNNYNGLDNVDYTYNGSYTLVGPSGQEKKIDFVFRPVNGTTRSDENGTNQS